jgi:anti-sigma B factor antagonist
MPMQLLTNQQVRDDAVVVRISGEVDMSTAEEFSSSLMTALHVASAHPARLLIADLDGVGFFGSKGLNAVLACHKHGLTTATAVRLVATTRTVVRMIEVTALDTVLALYPSITEAVQAPDPDLRG